MRRLRSGRTLTTLGAGLAVALLLGGGLVALIGDSVTVSGGVTSDDYQDPPQAALDLQIVEVATRSSSCDDLPYGDSVIGASGVTIDLTPRIDNNFFIRSNVGHFCLRNASDSDGVLSVTLLARSSSEAGTCGSTELAAEQALGAATCNDNDTGELDGVLTISVDNLPPLGAESCDSTNSFQHTTSFLSSTAVNTTFAFNDSGIGNSPFGPAVVLAAEATCNITLSAHSTSSSGPADLNLWKAAATDTLSLDVAINLEDPNA